MICSALMIIPAVSAAACFLSRKDSVCRKLLVYTAGAHALLTALAFATRTKAAFDSYFGLDAAGLLILSMISGLFLAASIYANAWLSRESAAAHDDQPVYAFAGCLLLFLFSMTAVACSQHMGILWVAVEATTLSSAPLIYFHRNHRSLEAAWKYLLICSVGIAMALLGNLFLVVSSATVVHGVEAPMLMPDLLKQASSMNHTWLKAAFIFLLVGYGTKMGLAPLHTWLPDAHSQAPSPVSALLSGALLNCAFLGLYRASQILAAAGLTPFSSSLFVLFGLLSMAWAAVFLVRQSDYKRLLAYSSVENLGIISVAAGLGRQGLAGCFLHILNHSLVKAMLFLAAGNLLYAFQTKRIVAVRGARRIVPASAALWLVGFLALSGLPPFGTFVSKFLIVKAAIEGGNYLMAGLFLALLAAIFVSMSFVFLPMFFGESPKDKKPVIEAGAMLVPLFILCLLSALLGLYIPPFIRDLITEAGGSLL